MKILCTRRLTFCAAHRLMGHEGGCANLHGHNYTVEVTATGDLDPVGRVVDFAEIKQGIGGWIDANWDHGFIHRQDDPLATLVGGKVFALAGNPTAENMAEFLLNWVAPLVLPGVTVTRVRVWETETSYAEVTK